MMRTPIGACGVVLVALACPATARDAGSGQARIRFMDMFNDSYTVWSGSSCQKKGEKTMAVPGFTGLFAGLSGKGAKTIKIGMPPSYSVAHRQKNILGGSFGYQERAVAANVPTTILVQIQAMDSNGVLNRTTTCSVPIGFVPAAGRDYELTGRWARGGCGFSVKDITENRTDADQGRELPVATAGAVTPDAVTVVQACNAPSR